jgi:hypothetical protein
LIAFGWDNIPAEHIGPILNRPTKLRGILINGTKLQSSQIIQFQIFGIYGTLIAAQKKHQYCLVSTRDHREVNIRTGRVTYHATKSPTPT